MSNAEDISKTIADSMSPLQKLGWWETARWLRANWRVVSPIVFRQLVGNIWAGKITTGAAIVLASTWQLCGYGVLEGHACGLVKDYGMHAAAVILLFSGNPIALAKLLPEALVAAAKKAEGETDG